MDATADNNINNNNVNVNSNNTNAAVMATNSALQCLYYVPGVVTGTTFIGGRYVPITAATHGSEDHDNVSSTSTSSSSSDQNGGGAIDDDDNNDDDDDDESLPEAAPSPKRIKTTGVRKAKKGMSGATAAVATTSEPSKSAARKESKHSFHYKAKPSRSSKAAMEQGETELPKGVTVRPSGKWVRCKKQASCTRDFV